MGLEIKILKIRIFYLKPNKGTVRKKVWFSELDTRDLNPGNGSRGINYKKQWISYFNFIINNQRPMFFPDVLFVYIKSLEEFILN